MDPLVASRSPWLTAHRLKPSPVRSEETWWQQSEPLSPHDPTLTGIMSEVLAEVGADVGPSSGKSVQQPASVIWFGLTALLQLWAKSDQKLIKVIAEKEEWGGVWGGWRSLFFILLLSNLFITTRLNLQHREKRRTQLLVEDVSAGIHLCLYCDVVNIGLAEIFYWFDHIRRRALM